MVLHTVCPSRTRAGMCGSSSIANVGIVLLREVLSHCFRVFQKIIEQDGSYCCYHQNRKNNNNVPPIPPKPSFLIQAGIARGFITLPIGSGELRPSAVGILCFLSPWSGLSPSPSIANWTSSSAVVVRSAAEPSDSCL